MTGGLELARAYGADVVEPLLDRALPGSLSPSPGSGPGPTCSGSTTTRRATTTGDCA